MSDMITTEGPVSIGDGYFEYRVNYTAEALFAMSGEELERFKRALRTLDELAAVSRTGESPS